MRNLHFQTWAVCLFLAIVSGGLISFVLFDDVKANDNLNVNSHRKNSVSRSEGAGPARDSQHADQRLAPDAIASIIGEYCQACHADGDDSEAGLDLSLVSRKSLEDDAKLAQDLLDAVASNHMPPESEPQLSEEEREEWLAELSEVRRLALGKSGEAKRTPIRRLNRFQYNNAVVDLLELKCIVFTLPERAMRGYDDYFNPASGKMPEVVRVGNRPLGKSQMIERRLSGVAAFPQDLRAEHGYDNQADHLSLSPVLLNEFLRLGFSITESPDFVPRNVGVWGRLFKEPVDTEVGTEIRSRLGWFLKRAFRAPVEDAQLERYALFVERKLDEGSSFTEAMKMSVAAALASPKFLYLYDKEARQDDFAHAQAIDDFELASRLAFFLWGSIPDEQLLLLAEQGKLSETAILNEQIDRMLLDRKLKRFCESFPSQWMQLDRIVSAVPDRDKFPGFYYLKYRLSMHMMLEPLLLFETILIENRPVTDFIAPDFTYRSHQLDQAYGDLKVLAQPGKGTEVGALRFKRAAITDLRTGGVITNAAVMTMTSGPNRTQPITRGAWVAGVVFNDPPEPPPADVPPLPEANAVSEEDLTLRERLAAHRKRSDCRGCHEQIDPLGFALENFDPVGRWRMADEKGRDIDVSGNLFRTHEFASVVDFKKAILAEEERFCRAFAAHLLSYGLARELGPADQIALDQIVEQTAEDEYRIKSLIRQIILSEPFRSKP